MKTLGKLTGITLGAKALVDFGKAAIKTSSDLEEIQNVTDTVFKNMAKDVDEFSKSLIESHGLGELSAKKYASYMGAMLKSSGIQGDAVRQMSKDLTLLTADMASFYNLETEEMFQKLMSGMSGATMPLKQLGINMNVANLEAFALSQGIRKSWQEMSQAEQVMLRYNYLMAVTGDAQGDFARNSWTWANSVKILSEKWKEFLGIIGKGLQAVVLPLVKALIKVLDILIAIARAVEKVYVMITGKKVDVEPRQVGIVDEYTDTIGDMGDFADDAAKNQKKLSKGIKDAAKAAKGALAPFDELNILQQNLAGGGKGGAGGAGGLGDIGRIADEINNTFKVEPVTDNIFKKIEDDGNRFFAWFFDKWNRLKELVSIPIQIPEPIFPILPVPIFEPEWGLDIPRIPSPVFPPIPSPVYRPNWNLTPPPVPQIAFPPIIYTAYNQSLQTIKNLMTQTKTSLEHSYGQLRENLTTQTSIIGRNIQQGLSTAWSTVEGNLRTHRTNVGVIATGIGSVLAVNIGRGLSIMGRNVNNAITTVQNNLNTFGRGAASAAAEIGRSFSYNVSQGFNTAIRNFSNFVRGMGTNLRSFGSGMLSGALQTARGFVNNLVSGFQTVWSNFRNLMSNMGERVGGWFSANRSVIGKVAIGVGVGAAVAGIAIAAPQMIPFAAKGLGALAAIPMLAEGAVIDPNDEFLAILGDQKSGRNIETPERLLRQIMQEELKNKTSSSGETPIELTINLGDKKIYHEIINGINQASRQAGKTLINI